MVTDQVTIRSSVQLRSDRIEWIEREVELVKDRFRGCVPGPIEVRIVSQSVLNSPDYFYWVDTRYTTYGQYYRLAEVIYVTPYSFTHHNILDHELYHWLLNDCGWGLTEDQEHELIREWLNE